jgi:hypothetical protein
MQIILKRFNIKHPHMILNFYFNKKSTVKLMFPSINVSGSWCKIFSRGCDKKSLNLSILFDFPIGVSLGAGATFDWLFFDNSKVVNFDD